MGLCFPRLTEGCGILIDILVACSDGNQPLDGMDNDTDGISFPYFVGRCLFYMYLQPVVVTLSLPLPCLQLLLCCRNKKANKHTRKKTSEEAKSRGTGKFT